MVYMLRLTLLQFFLRGIPEIILTVWAIYVFSFKEILIKPFVISSFLFTITVYIVRLLPIHYGVHTIIIVSFYILINFFISKISINKSISAAFLSIILLSTSELINMMILDLSNINLNSIGTNSISGILYTWISLFIFGSIIFVFYKTAYKSKIASIRDSNSQSS